LYNPVPGIIDNSNIIGSFKEKQGLTVIIDKNEADRLNLHYTYVAAWITLSAHSSLEAVGLTAAFSAALAKEGISCNVIAGYYHDHIFVAQRDAHKAIQVLELLSSSLFHSLIQSFPPQKYSEGKLWFI
jgi:hypothetical protein